MEEAAKISVAFFQIAINQARRASIVRNPFFLDSESGFEWTLNPVFSGQCFLQVLPAV
jgi:hypothetical protein